MGFVATLGISVLVFTGIIMFVVVLLLMAKSKLVSTGDVKLHINDQEDLTKTVPAGATLLNTLSNLGIFIPSACGGGGTCAMCKCQVIDGGGDIGPTETGHRNRYRRRRHSGTEKKSAAVRVKTCHNYRYLRQPDNGSEPSARTAVQHVAAEVGPQNVLA